MIYILVLLIVSVLLISYKTYVYAFRMDPRRQALEDEVPDLKLKMKVVKNIYSLMHEPFEPVDIVSHDGLKLHGRYYHFIDGAPVAVIMHGYRSNYCRDGNGGFRIAKEYGLNILMPDQRAHGKSEGKHITFGIKEKYDCALWAEYIEKRFGSKIGVVLVGLSMGAATVMMASDIAGENVKGIVADCGFNSPKDILTEVSRQMKIPGKLGYFFARLGGRIFGGFDTEETDAMQALSKTKIPVLFIHGDSDNYVPCYMSTLCYESCNSKKDILIIKGATHGMSYYVDTESYTKRVRDFFDMIF